MHVTITSSHSKYVHFIKEPLLQSCKQTEVRQTIHCTNDSSKVGGTIDISNQPDAPPTGSNHLPLVVRMYLLLHW